MDCGRGSKEKEEVGRRRGGVGTRDGREERLAVEGSHGGG